MTERPCDWARNPGPPSLMRRHHVTVMRTVNVYSTSAVPICEHAHHGKVRAHFRRGGEEATGSGISPMCGRLL